MTSKLSDVKVRIQLAQFSPGFKEAPTFEHKACVVGMLQIVGGIAAGRSEMSRVTRDGFHLR